MGSLVASGLFYVGTLKKSTIIIVDRHHELSQGNVLVNSLPGVNQFRLVS